MNKQRRITLNIDFNVEKAKLQEVGSILGKDLDKNVKGSKIVEYIDTAKKSMSGFYKQVHGLYNELSKPLVSKAQAKELASSIGNAFAQIDSKLLSLQGNIGKTFSSVANTEAIKRIKTLTSEIEELKNDYQEISQLTSKSRGLGNKNDLKSQIAGASKELDAFGAKQGKLTNEELKRQKELKKVLKEANKILEEKNAINDKITAIQEKNGYGTQSQLETVIATKTTQREELLNGTIMPEELSMVNSLLSEMRQLLSSISATSNATIPSVVGEFDAVVQAEKEAEAQAKSFKSILQELGIPMLSLHEIVSMLRQVVSYSYDYVKNLDAALTEIAVVSDKTRKEVMELTDTFIELSQKTGMAIDDIAQASTIFYQQGLNDEAVKKMTEWTALFAKISGEDVPTAADQLTAAINGFGFAAEDVSQVVDKMSVLAAYSAADIDELATAMSKGASQAAMAGLTFDEYNAYLATMIETTREAPENLGTSLKTIMSRFQSIKTGDNTEDDTSVNDVEKALKTVGVQLRDSEGQLRELGDVLNDLGPKWATLDRNTQAYLGTVIAGTRQQSRFVSLMQNWDRALELTTASENSAGAAARMHAKAMEGLEASLNTLTNAWQKLISNLANGDSFKWIIDGLSSLVGWFGEGNTALKLLTTAVVIWNAKTLMTNLSLAAQGKAYKNLDTVVLTVAERIKLLTGNITGLADPMSKETLAIQTQTQAIRDQIQAYQDLSVAKQGGVVNPNIATTGDIGTPAPGTNVGVPGGVGEVTEEIKNLGEESATSGGKVQNVTKNITGLLGKIQVSILAFTATLSLLEGIEDALYESSEEIASQAQAEYDKIQEEIDKNLILISTIESSLGIYDELSKKLNKSAEEVEQLAEAADELAKAAPGALIGYDANGNAIIDVGAAKAEAKNAEAELVEQAKEQIGSIGNLARAELKAEAEQNYSLTSHSKATKTTSTIGKIGAGLGAAAGVAAVGAAGSTATIAGAPIGVVLGVAAAVLGGLGAALTFVSGEAKEAKINEEQLALAREKAQKITKEQGAQLAQNISYLTNAKLRQSNVDGVGVNERTTIANYISNEWLNRQTQDLFDKLATEKITEKEFEKSYKQLGDKWEKVLDKVDDSDLAKAYTEINKVADNIGDKTYSSVEKSIKDIIKNDLGIKDTDPLFKTLKQAFMKAAYSGLGTGIYGVIDELKTAKGTAIEKATSDAEATAIAAKYDEAIKKAKGLTSNELNVYAEIGITDNVDLFNNMVREYSATIKEALVTSTEAAAVQSIVILSKYRDDAIEQLNKIAATQGEDDYTEIDYDKLTEKQKANYDYWVQMAEDAADSIEQAWGTMDISMDIPWKELWESFEKLTERVRTARETLGELIEGKGISPEQWKEFTTMFDNIDFEGLDAAQINQYVSALNTVADNLVVINGQLYANGSAIEHIAELERAAIQASIEATKVELINKQIELEASKAVVDAEIATLEYKIKEAEGAIDAENAKTKAQQAWAQASNRINTFYVQNQAKVTSAIVNQYADAFAEIAMRYNKLQTGMADGTLTEKEIKAIGKDWNALVKELNFDSYEDKLSKYTTEELKKQLAAAKEQSEIYGAKIANINLKLATLNSGLFYAKNGVGSGDSKEIEKYIGQLEEIFNTLRKIEGITARIKHLEDYRNFAQGELAAQYLREQINLSEDLFDLNKKLLAQQKYMENTEQQAILNSPVGHVFSFDEFGNIIIDYKKYNALQDESIDGQQTLKELADELYDEYKELHDTTLDYYEDLIASLQSSIDLQQTLVDTYIDLEKNLAEAVKDIYQDMLDNKLEAIDTEIEALNKLKEAREEANKAKEDSKDLSDLQSSLKRAMMDTSGASNTKVLSYQDQIRSKLEEMGEDEYTKRLDAITESLENQKEQLQREFDEFFEDYEALYDMIENRIINDEDSVLGVLQTTDEFLKASDGERKQLLTQWKTDYEIAMEAISEGKSILDVIDTIDLLKGSVVEIDKTLKDKSFAESVGSTISQALTKYLNGVASASAGNSSGYNGSSSYNSNSSSTLKPVTIPTGAPDNNGNPSGGSTAKNYNTHWVMSSKDNQITEGLSKTGAYVAVVNKNGVKSQQNIWKVDKGSYIANAGEYVYWKGSEGTYKKLTGVSASQISKNQGKILTFDKKWLKDPDLRLVQAFKHGGMSYHTGPAWLDGTKSAPEAVLDAAQTQAFLKLADHFDELEGAVGNNIVIENISFQVDSMSSPADGERAFDAFVNRFKEIGSQTGLSFNKTRL